MLDRRFNGGKATFRTSEVPQAMADTTMNSLFLPGNSQVFTNLPRKEIIDF